MSERLPNLLTMTVTHNVQWSQNDEGRVVITCPRITNPVMKKLLSPFVKKQHYDLTLDEYGSFVWLHIDGKSTVHTIANALENQFGEKIQPVYDRLGLFLRILANRKYIQLIPE